MKILTSAPCVITPYVKGKPLLDMVNSCFCLPGSVVVLPDCVDSISIDSMPDMSELIDCISSNS